MSNTNTRRGLLYAADLDPAAALALCQQAAATAIRHRHHAQWSEYIQTLYIWSRTQRLDRAAALELRDSYAAALDAARADAASAARMLRRADLSEDERCEVVDLLTAAVSESQTAAADAAAVDDVLHAVATDYADIVSAAIVRYYELQTQPAEPSAHLCAEYGCTVDDWCDSPDAAEIKSRAQYKALTAAASAALNAARALDALDTVHTDLRPAAPADVEQWRRSMGGTGADIRRPLPGGQWQTMEWREGTRTHPRGWYTVTHRRTVRAAAALDEMTAQRVAAPMQDGREVSAALHAAHLHAVLTAAGLTERERLWLAAYASPAAEDAATAAEDAAARRAARHGWSAARRAAVRNAAHKAAARVADAAIGCSSLDAARVARRRLWRKLTAAAERVSPDADRAATRAERAHIRAAAAAAVGIPHLPDMGAALLPPPAAPAPLPRKVEQRRRAVVDEYFRGGALDRARALELVTARALHAAEIATQWRAIAAYRAHPRRNPAAVLPGTLPAAVIAARGMLDAWAEDERRAAAAAAAVPDPARVKWDADTAAARRWMEQHPDDPGRDAARAARAAADAAAAAALSERRKAVYNERVRALTAAIGRPWYKLTPAQQRGITAAACMAREMLTA